MKRTENKEQRTVLTRWASTLLLSALCSLLASPVYAVCPDAGCSPGRYCARDARIPEGSACFTTCRSATGGSGGCTGTDVCVTVTGQEVCVPASSPLATGGEVANPVCTEGRTCPADRTYECVAGECRIPSGQPCERTAQCVTDTECVAPPTGGATICNPVAPAPSGGTTAPPEEPFVPIIPRLGAPIPGTELTAAIKTGDYVDVPYLAQYINGAYRYLVGIVLIAAIVMTVYGGFRYLVGASLGDIKAGKKIISNALIGMLITLGAYMILNTINPATLNLSVLRLAFVERENLEFIPAADYTAATGLPVPTTAEVSAVLHEVATELGVDECGLYAVAIGESGGRADAIGYDSNAPSVQIFSRRAFIRSGLKYNGETFPGPDLGPWSGSECRPSREGLNAAQIAAIQNRELRNTGARFNPAAPPDFGLDTRFSVGIGAAQVTLLPDSSCRLPRCPNGMLGREVGGTCYTVPELLQPRAQMIAASRIYTRAYDRCDEYASDPYIRQVCTFARYGGTGCTVRSGSCLKMALWTACRGIPNREVTNCRQYWRSQTDEYCDDFNNR